MLLQHALHIVAGVSLAKVLAHGRLLRSRPRGRDRPPVFPLLRSQLRQLQTLPLAAPVMPVHGAQYAQFASADLATQTYSFPNYPLGWAGLPKLPWAVSRKHGRALRVIEASTGWLLGP